MFRLKRTDFIVACALNTKRKYALYKDLLIENGILEEACELNTKNTDSSQRVLDLKWRSERIARYVINYYASQRVTLKLR